MAGFIFGGNTGETPESIARKRAIAAALMKSNNRQPQNVGEAIGQGLNGFGEALLYRSLVGDADKAEAEGKATAANDASALFVSPVAKALSSNIPMTDAAGEVSATSPGGSGNYRDAIASIESAGSGDYNAVGPTHPKMGRALGRYQIMETNIGPWSQEALGRTITPEEFMADPKLQDAIFDSKFGSYVQKYGPEGAAQAWLGGPGGVGKTDRRDSLGTSIGEYGQRFMKAAGGGTQVASLDPSAGMSAADAIEAVAPQSGGYRDPMVSAPNSRGAVASALMSPAPQTAQPSPVVAALSSPQASPRNASEALPASEMASTANAAVAPRNQTVAQALSSSPAQLQPEYYPPAPSPAGQTGPSMQQIMQVLNNPYSSEANKAYAQSLLEQRQKQSDPDAQLNREYKRAQLDALKGKPTKTWQRLDDTTLFNPETGETQRVNAPAAGNGQFRFDGKSVEAQALNGLMDAGALTPAQAQQLGAGKTITGPNGEIIFMTPQGVFGQSADGTVSPVSAPPPQPPAAPQSPAGVDIFGGDTPVAPTPPAPPQAPQQPQAAPQRQGMIPLTEPKVTQDESKAAGFAHRMLEQEKILGDVDGVVKGWAGTFGNMVSDNDYIPDAFESSLMSSDFQRYDTARRNFVNAQMRRESGAVIGKDEFANANKQYFPMPGDSEQTIRDKAQARKTVIEAMIRDAGPTFKNPADQTSAPNAVKSQSEYEALPSGAEFIAPDGSRRRKP